MLRAAGVLLAMLAGAQMARSEMAPAPQVLVYPNGDRLQGRLVARDGKMLVFQSVRFGELRVPADKASVVSAPPAIKHTKTAKAAAVAKAPEEEPDASASIAEWLKDFFGPWSGRLAVSGQLYNDTRTRNDFTVETRLVRKWPRDEVSTSARYNYSKTDGRVTSDVIRSNGMWRHTMPHRMFMVYRPTYEWNRAYKINGVSSDYVMLQQEVGAGATVLKTKRGEVRAGVAENLFDTWDETGGNHDGTHAESVFSEADFQLPWRISLAERAVYYYAISTGYDGWEHQFEITKKLTDALSLGVKHEVRSNDPDVRSQDYSLLRLLLGLDF